MKNVSILGVALLSLTASATESANSPLQQGVLEGCVARGLQRGSPSAEVTKFCTCTLQVLKAELTDRDWSELENAGREKRSPDSIPAINKAMPKLLQCKKPS